MVPGHEHPVVQTGVLACCLSVNVRQLIFQGPLWSVMQANGDGQGRGLLQLLLSFAEHLDSGQVLAGFIVDSSRTTTEHGLVADLDLVGGPVTAGAGNAVELVLIQAEDLAPWPNARSLEMARVSSGDLVVVVMGVPPLSLL